MSKEGPIHRADVSPCTSAVPCQASSDQIPTAVAQVGEPSNTNLVNSFSLLCLSLQNNRSWVGTFGQPKSTLEYAVLTPSLVPFFFFSLARDRCTRILKPRLGAFTFTSILLLPLLHRSVGCEFKVARDEQSLHALRRAQVTTIRIEFLAAYPNFFSPDRGPYLVGGRSIIETF